MYHMITTEGGAHLSPGQHRSKRQIASEGPDFSAPSFGSVKGRQQQSGLARADCFTNLLKTGDGKPGPPRQPYRITAALGQQRLDAIRKPGRY
jgi:hypothetical protein